MTTIIIGLFPTQKEAKNLATDLENFGFANEDYIVYINKETKHEENLWERLFGGRTPKFIPTDNDKLITSVAIKNEDQLKIAKQIFANHNAVHVYELNDIDINEAKSLDYLKKIVNTRAKAEVYTMPSVASAKLVKLNQGILLN
ncbi:hypothetical protein SAMN05421847_0388 [Halpernia humi]|uniref:Uncharacterized protein n=1 Tax=Halpernia humi TaxID=493375 RepID=A0A1H5T9H5_9FLAO|nr:hypothetical protein [Halpernia humi]SEF58647.1 hypothetical protein SAMN05421847_0388 [Halpernia humi]